MSASATANTNSRFHDTETGPSTSGDDGNGASIDLATPDHVNCSRFCSAIQAPIITSIVVSISALLSRRSSTNSSTAPRAMPSSTASTSAAKKLTSVIMTQKNII